jgi:hypothetical protein
VLQAIGEWIRVIVEVGCVEQIPRTGEPDVETQRPWPVDPRGTEERFGVIQIHPQSKLVWMVGFVPRRQPRRDPQLQGAVFRTGIPAHHHKVTRCTDKSPNQGCQAGFQIKVNA